MNAKDEKNEFLSQFGFNENAEEWKVDESKEVEPTAGMDLNKMFEKSKGHYSSYTGALTAPPCTKNVKYFLVLERFSVDNSQIDSFEKIFGAKTNVRGLQDLGTRDILVM